MFRSINNLTFNGNINSKHDPKNYNKLTTKRISANQTLQKLTVELTLTK